MECSLKRSATYHEYFYDFFKVALSVTRCYQVVMGTKYSLLMKIGGIDTSKSCARLRALASTPFQL